MFFSIVRNRGTTSMFKQISDRILFKQNDSPCAVPGGFSQVADFDHLMNGGSGELMLNARMSTESSAGSIDRSLRFDSESTGAVLEPPKRPPGAYACFLKQMFPEVKERFPDQPVYVVGKEISKLWKALNEEEKEVYKSEARAFKDDYQKELETFNSRLTLEDRKELENNAKLRKMAKERRSLKKERRNMNMPKQSKNPYTFYMLSQKRGDDEGIIDFAKRCSETWKTLTDSEKKTFVDLALRDKIRYMTEIENWESKMMKTGHFEVLRRRSRELAMGAMKRHQKSIMKEAISTEALTGNRKGKIRSSSSKEKSRRRTKSI